MEQGPNGEKGRMERESEAHTTADCRELQRTIRGFHGESGRALQHIKALLQGLYLGGELVEAGLKLGKGGRACGGWCGWRGDGGLDFGRAAEEMGEAAFAGSGLAGKLDGERAGGSLCAFVGCGAGGEAVERGLDLGEVVEREEAVGAAAEFAGGLRASEEEETEDGGLVAAEIEDGAGAVLVLGDAGVADGSDEGKLFEGVDGLADLIFGKVEDGVAAGALVARADEGVKGERVVLGSGDFLFDEGAENAELNGVKLHVYKVPQVRMRWLA